MIVKVADFTTLPGPRFISEGPESGELFRNEVLAPAFQRAVESKQPLTVVLDGMRFGYPASFLEESFGGLTRIWTDPSRPGERLTEEQVWAQLTVVSNDIPLLVETVHRYILDANKKKPVLR